MTSEHDFQYAIENTRVVVPPQQLIETFGTTSFNFLLVSELLDEVDKVRIRGGKIESERPRIVSPQTFQKLALEGFGDAARGFADWIEANADQFKILRYGFHFKKTDIQQSIVHESLDSVLGRLAAEIRQSGEAKSALISGVDDAWEVCLLKFTIELIHRSAGENLGEWKRRGLID